jgi:glycosyltransferase involved in cell wall biosynthesis
MKKNKSAVGILIHSLEMGGAEKQSLLQAKLMGTEFDVYYFVQKKKPQLKQHIDFINREKINYIQLSGNIVSRTIQILTYIKKNRIKVLFAYLTTDNVLAGIVSVFVKIKIVGGIRSSYLPFVKYYITWFLQKYFLDYVIFNNHFGRDKFIKNGFSSSKSIVIQNCINNIHSDITRPDRKIVRILSVGRFISLKDYYTALKTIYYLKSNSYEKEIEYTIVGDGELDQQIQTWIHDMQLENVTIVRSPDNIKDYYISSDIYFLSSISEGMPNAIMEALNYSLPVVSTDVGDVKYLVKEGINGFISPVKEYKMLAVQLSELVSDSVKRNTFGKIGHNLLINEFSERKFQEEYLNFTRKLLSSHPLG